MIVWIMIVAGCVMAVLVTVLALLSAAETLEDPLAQIERARLEQGDES